MIPIKDAIDSWLFTKIQQYKEDSLKMTLAEACRDELYETRQKTVDFLTQHLIKRGFNNLSIK